MKQGDQTPTTGRVQSGGFSETRRFRTLDAQSQTVTDACVKRQASSSPACDVQVWNSQASKKLFRVGFSSMQNKPEGVSEAAIGRCYPDLQ